MCKLPKKSETNANTWRKVINRMSGTKNSKYVVLETLGEANTRIQPKVPPGNSLWKSSISLLRSIRFLIGLLGLTAAIRVMLIGYSGE
jgi:hypothetical protein